MAGPSIVVRVLGDLKGLGSAFDNASSKGSSAAKGIHSAFSGMLGAINQTGVLGGFGDALAGIDQAIGQVIEHGKKIGPALAGAGAAMVGVGSLLSAAGSKDQAAHQQLQSAIEATGGSYEDYAKQIEAAIKHQEDFGHSADETQNALQTLTQATGDPAKALQYLGEASDLAAAKHEDLNAAAGQLGKTYNGATKMLKEFGISAAPKAGAAAKALDGATRGVASAAEASQKAHQKLADLLAIYRGKTHLTVAEQLKLRDAQQNVKDADAKLQDAHGKLAAAHDGVTAAAKGQQTTMDALAAKLKGQASASADTFTGKLDALKAKIEDTVATIGQKYGPAIQGIGIAAMAAASVVETASTIMAAGWFAAFWPVGVAILAIAALGIAVYELVTHFQAVIGWLQKHWGIIVEIIFGPFGLAFVLIYQHFQGVIDFFVGFGKTVAKVAVTMWHWISDAFDATVRALKAAWNGVVGWFAGLPGQIARIAAGMWHGISDAFNTAIYAIYGVWNRVWGWFTGIPGDIARAAAGMWHGIYDAFSSVIGQITHLWNSLSFKTPEVHIPGTPISIPSVHIGVPHLAQGGLITSTGLIYAHAGEAITPAKDVGRSGPAVVVNNAHFSTELDLETFVRKAAWHAKTQRL